MLGIDSLLDQITRGIGPLVAKWLPASLSGALPTGILGGVALLIALPFISMFLFPMLGILSVAFYSVAAIFRALMALVSSIAVGLLQSLTVLVHSLVPGPQHRGAVRLIALCVGVAALGAWMPLSIDPSRLLVPMAIVGVAGSLIVVLRVAGSRRWISAPALRYAHVAVCLAGVLLVTLSFRSDELRFAGAGESFRSAPAEWKQAPGNRTF